MYNKMPTAYRHNPLMDSTSKQISFLFGRIVYFIEEGDRLRNDQQYQEFAYQYQRAISVIHGLSSFLQSELNPKVAIAWDYYFLSLLDDINTHALDSNPMLLKKICDNLHQMEQLLKNVDIQNHIILNSAQPPEQEANDNFSTPSNMNYLEQKDINISI